jgi:WD40 repeat protein
MQVFEIENGTYDVCRCIVALSWSPDGNHLAVVTGDNAHTVHVYRLDLHLSVPSTCIFRGQCHRGEPPQVFGVHWNAFKKCVAPGSHRVVPGALEFVSFGVKHIKFWRYDPQQDTYVGSALSRCIGNVQFYRLSHEVS